MNTYISLLRGINVSGQKKIKMLDLKLLYESLGFEGVQTYIQSGNVIFKDQQENITNLVAQIEQKILEEFGYQVTTFIYSPEDFQVITSNNPFLKATPDLEIKQLFVTYLSQAPEEKLIQELEPYAKNGEEYHLSGKILYLNYPNSYGKTKLDNNTIERKLKLSATTRNWRTTLKLYEMTQG